MKTDSQTQRELHWRISAKLDDIRAMFERPDDVRLTVVVRTPWIEDGGVLVTDDDEKLAVAEIERLSHKAAVLAACAKAGAP